MMKRIQRKRTKGWKMPENTIYVGRPTKWGNPFRLIQDCIYVDAGWRRGQVDKWVFWAVGNEKDIINLYGMLFEKWPVAVSGRPDFDYWNDHFIKLDLTELKGKDLACWCKIVDKNNNYIQCHADILLSLSNNLLLNDVKNENIREEKLLQKR